MENHPGLESFEMIAKAAEAIAKVCRSLPHWLPEEEAVDLAVDVHEGIARSACRLTKELDRFADLLTAHKEDGIEHLVWSETFKAVMMCAAAGSRINRAADEADRKQRASAQNAVALGQARPPGEATDPR